MQLRRLLNALSILLLTTSAFSQLLPPDERWVDETLASMTLDQKIGQLFIPVHRSVDSTLAMIRRHHIGGLWFAWHDVHRIAEELNELQRQSAVPLLVTVDFEKGAGTYVDGATDLPANMALGASQDPDLAYRAAALTAREARAFGIHLNYAPVLDVNNNALNPVINTRSYGEDPALVSLLGQAAVRGYQENGLLATGKHFPGHGNTTTDTHSSLGVVEGDSLAFENTELRPFREVLASTDLSSIMSAHLWIRALDADTIPATLSPAVMDGLLRKRLGFDGLVLTDAMVMGGITTRYPFRAAVVHAIRAGCDIILFPGSMSEGTEALRDAVGAGTLTEARIDASVRRILRAKSRVGLHREALVDLSTIASAVGTEENYAEAKAIAARCLTLARDTGDLIPLNSGQTAAVITMTNKQGRSMLSRDLVVFPEYLARHVATRQIDLSDAMTPEEQERALAAAREADVAVVAAYVKIVLNSGTVELPAEHTRFVERLLAVQPKTILVSFGNPYIGASVPGVPAYLCAFDNAKALQETAADALAGKARISGRLPVTVAPDMPVGFGIGRN